MIRTALTAAVVLALCTAGTAAATAADTAPAARSSAGASHTTHRAPHDTLPARPVTRRNPVRGTTPAHHLRSTANAARRRGTTHARTPQHARRTHMSLAALHPDLLQVTYDNGHGVVTSRLLWCHPAGGSMRGTLGACRRLDALGGPLRVTPRREMCSMVYGGPQTARVTGMWRGHRVDQRYSRSNGCQTTRWQRMEPVLPGFVAHRAAAVHHPKRSSRR